MYIIGAVLTACWAIPYFALLNTKDSTLVFVAIALSLIPHNMQYGPQAALIAETFPTRLRYSGAGIGYQLASVVAGGPAPLMAVWLLHTFNSTLPIALYIIFGAVVTVIATVLLPEPGRAAVARELEEGAQAPVPEVGADVRGQGGRRDLLSAHGVGPTYAARARRRSRYGYSSSARAIRPALRAIAKTASALPASSPRPPLSAPSARSIFGCGPSDAPEAWASQARRDAVTALDGALDRVTDPDARYARRRES